MKKLLILMLLGACVEDGEMGTRGPAGPEGPAGAAAAGGLVWKDGGGTVVENSFVGFRDNTFAMRVTDADGVFFTINPLNGTPIYQAYNSASLTRFYLAPGCVGPTHYAIDTTPKVAFKFDGRTVAMPADVEIATTIGSYYSGGCYAATQAGAYVKGATLDGLPTLTPPVLGVGPFHVTRM